MLAVLIAEVLQDAAFQDLGGRGLRAEMQRAVEIGGDSRGDSAGLAALGSDRLRCQLQCLLVGLHELGAARQSGEPHAWEAGAAEVAEHSTGLAIYEGLNVFQSDVRHRLLNSSVA